MTLPGDNALEDIMKEMGASVEHEDFLGEEINGISSSTSLMASAELISFGAWRRELGAYKLRRSFVDGGCEKYKVRKHKSSKPASTRCKSCGRSDIEHELEVTKSLKDNSLLYDLFAMIRNLRCVLLLVDVIGNDNQDDRAHDVYLSRLRKQLQHLWGQMDASKDISFSSVGPLHKSSGITQTDRSAIVDAGLLSLFPPKRMPKGSVKSSSLSTRSQSGRRQMALVCDKVYYRLFYASHGASPLIPPLHVYLLHILSIYQPETKSLVTEGALGSNVVVSPTSRLLRRLSPTVRAQLEQWLCLSYDTSIENSQDRYLSSDSSVVFNHPLHCLWKHRWFEMVALFYGDPRLSVEDFTRLESRPNHLLTEFQIHETLCPSLLLAEWRDVARDFAASTYSYATPTPHVLSRLATILYNKNVVEVGAGTGYWACLLQRLDHVSVQAFDKDPPGASYNDYHGEMRPYTHVYQGDVDIPTSLDNILFLCYPPPGTNMAWKAVRLFGGSVVIHVGEWAGLTGDSRFEDFLLDNFGCIESILLPSWGTDAAYVTVWARGAPTVRRPGAGGCIACQEQRATRRCRFARILQYCDDPKCFASHAEDRKSYLLLQMIELADGVDLDLRNDEHFHTIPHSGQKVKTKRKRKM